MFFYFLFLVYYIFPFKKNSLLKCKYIYIFLFSFSFTLCKNTYFPKNNLKNYKGLFIFIFFSIVGTNAICIYVSMYSNLKISYMHIYICIAFVLYLVDQLFFYHIRIYIYVYITHTNFHPLFFFGLVCFLLQKRKIYLTLPTASSEPPVALPSL